MAKARTASAGKKGESKTMIVRLELEPSDHQAFRVESAKEGLPMALMARRLVKEWLAKRGAK